MLVVITFKWFKIQAIQTWIRIKILSGGKKRKEDEGKANTLDIKMRHAIVIFTRQIEWLPAAFIHYF